ncbi:MAG: TIGR00153 family protein [Verrucomicrobiales bacterium]|nr:TIGR00153 family protein [Verrucomicrobiales bacterium]
MKSTNPIGKLLRGSPFAPIQQHMRVVKRAVAMVPELFEALKAGKQDEVCDLADKINATESEADELKTDYRAHMPSTFLMPVDRRDLLMLIAEQDRIADKANAIGRVLRYRKMKIPDGLVGHLDELIADTMGAYGQAENVVEQLDELMEGGFSGKESKRVGELIHKLRDTEESTDSIIEKVNRALFAIEDELKPVDVMFWYGLIEQLGEIANRAENVGDRVLLLIAR